MLVLGVHRGHDAGVCLFDSGRIVCVVEAERIFRIKHADGPGTIAECARVAFQEAGIQPHQVQKVVIADSYRDKIEANLHGMPEALHHPDLLGPLGTVDTLTHIGGGDLGIVGLRGDVPVFAACHHACHAAAAVYMSGYEESLVYVYDGYGTCCGTVGYKYWNGKLQRLPESVDKLLVGWRYQLPGYFLRDIDKSKTKIYDFAGKLMGLSAFGKARPDVVLALKDWLHQGYENYHQSWDASSNWWFPGLVNKQGFKTDMATAQDPDFCCLLASLQAAVNEAVTEEVAVLASQHGLTRIVLTGGCALNILANDALERHPDIDSLFVPPNAGDAGLAMGAAVIGGASDGTALHFPAIAVPEKRSPYKGPHLLRDNALTILQEHARDEQRDRTATLDQVVGKLRDGGIVGFVKGPLEIGPRALGHRSLLADATRADMRELLNTKIKKREWWRPFGPVARSIDASEYFEFHDGCPYMLRSVTVRNEWRERLVPVTHVDGSARLQVITDESTHPELWYILSQLKELTGVGVCLNTSLNLGGLPIMNSGQEIADFLRSTGVDLMYVDGMIIKCAL